jgi:hypothetical protein
MPAPGYVHGLTGPVVVLPAGVARWLEEQTDLPRRRVAVRGDDVELDQALLAIRLAAMQVGAVPGAAVGTDPPAMPVAEPELTVNQAAHRIGIRPRAVRRALEEQRLAGRKAGGRWLIQPADADHYRHRMQGEAA